MHILQSVNTICYYYSFSLPLYSPTAYPTGAFHDYTYLYTNIYHIRTAPLIQNKSPLLSPVSFQSKTSKDQLHLQSSLYIYSLLIFLLPLW